MDWYLDLWMEQPMKASVLIEILLLLMVVGILLYSDSVAQGLQEGEGQGTGVG